MSQALSSRTMDSVTRRATTVKQPRKRVATYRLSSVVSALIRVGRDYPRYLVRNDGEIIGIVDSKDGPRLGKLTPLEVIRRFPDMEYEL